MTSPMPDVPSADTVVKTAETFARDLLERVLSTFLQAFLGGVVVTQPLNGSMWYAALGAGVAAAASLLKGFAARMRSIRNSASLAEGV